MIAPSVIDAEIAAKVVLLAGHSEGLDWLEAEPGCEGMVVLENGRRMVSRYFYTYLWRDA